MNNVNKILEPYIINGITSPFHRVETMMAAQHSLYDGSIEFNHYFDCIEYIYDQKQSIYAGFTLYSLGTFCYQRIKHLVNKIIRSSFGEYNIELEHNQNNNFLKRLSISMLRLSAITFISYPLEVIKIRIHCDIKYKKEEEKNVINMILTLYKGFTARLLYNIGNDIISRFIHYGTIKILTYFVPNWRTNEAQQIAAMINYNGNHIVTYIHKTILRIFGSNSVIFTYPLYVISIRMALSDYNGYYHLIYYKMYKEYGIFKGFYCGLGIHFAKKLFSNIFISVHRSFY